MIINSNVRDREYQWVLMNIKEPLNKSEFVYFYSILFAKVGTPTIRGNNGHRTAHDAKFAITWPWNGCRVYYINPVNLHHLGSIENSA